MHGKVTTIEIYRGDDQPISAKRRTELSIPTPTRQQLLEVILQQLDLLKQCNVVEFSVYANPANGEPSRIVVVGQELL